MYKSLTTASEASPEEKKRREDEDRTAERFVNFGFGRLERLEGNVGYLEMTRFSGYVGDEAGAVATAAMAYLSHCEAIILDLRRNPGGSGRMAQLLASYFFAPDDDRWLISNENRSKGTSRQEWTQPYVPGTRMPDIPLYILVGSQTGSAAEGFAYNLQAQKRATIVGGKTAGGAHSGSYIAIDQGFVMFLPVGRTVNPITKSNWERVGIQPDIAEDPKKALQRAYWLALLEVSKRPHSVEQRIDIGWMLDVLKAQTDPQKISESEATELAGKYSDHEGVTEISFESGRLYYRFQGKAKYPLAPVGDRRFVVEGYDSYGPNSGRLSFEPATGKPTAAVLEIHHAPGKIAKFVSERQR